MTVLAHTFDARGCVCEVLLLVTRVAVFFAANVRSAGDLLSWKRNAWRFLNRKLSAIKAQFILREVTVMRVCNDNGTDVSGVAWRPL